MNVTILNNSLLKSIDIIKISLCVDERKSNFEQKSNEFIQNRNAYIAAVNTIDEMIKSLFSNLSRKYYFQYLVSLKEIRKELIFYLILGLQDCGSNFDRLSSFDDTYEVLTTKLLSVLIYFLSMKPRRFQVPLLLQTTQKSSESMNESLSIPIDEFIGEMASFTTQSVADEQFLNHYSDISDDELQGPLLAQIIQIILLLIKSSIKHVNYQSITVLSLLLDTCGSINDWRQYFPGVFSGLYTILNDSKTKQSFNKYQEKFKFKAYNCLLKIIIIVCNDSDRDNQYLLYQISSAMNIQSNGMNNETLETLIALNTMKQKYLSPSTNAVSSNDQRSINTESHLLNHSVNALNSKFPSIDAFITWRVDLLQRLEKNMCRLSREIVLNQSSVGTTIDLLNKQAIRHLCSIVVSCSKFIGLSGDLIYEFIDQLAYHYDMLRFPIESNQIDSEVIISIRRHIQRSFQSFIDSHANASRQITSKLSYKIIQHNENLKTSSEPTCLHKLLGYGILYDNELSIIIRSLTIDDIQRHILPIFLPNSDQFESSDNHLLLRSNYNGIVSLEYLYYGFTVSFKNIQTNQTIAEKTNTSLSINRLWLGYYRFAEVKYSSTWNKQLRRLGLLLGRYGTVEKILNLHEKVKNELSKAELERSKALKYNQRMKTYQSMNYEYLTQERRKLLIEEDLLTSMRDFNDDSMRKHNQIISQSNAIVIAKLREVYGLWEMTRHGLFGLVTVKTNLLNDHVTLLSSSKPIDNQRSNKPDAMRVCYYCNSISKQLHRCSRCKQVWYCSADHQKKDWSQHKLFCKESSPESANNNQQLNQSRIDRDLKSIESNPFEEKEIFDNYELLSFHESLFVESSNEIHLLRISSTAMNLVKQFLSHSFSTTSNEKECIIKDMIISVCLDVLGHLMLVLSHENKHKLIRQGLYCLLEVFILKDSDILKQSASSTIHRWRVYCGYDSIGKMMMSHLDHIIDQTSQALRMKIQMPSNDDRINDDESVRASNILDIVLSLITSMDMNHSHENQRQKNHLITMSRMAIEDMLQSTMKSIDEYTEYGIMDHSKTYAMLQMIRSLIHRLYPIPDNLSDYIENLMQFPSLVLKSILFPRYCVSLKLLYDPDNTGIKTSIHEVTNDGAGIELNDISRTSTNKLSLACVNLLEFTHLVADMNNNQQINRNDLKTFKESLLNQSSVLQDYYSLAPDDDSGEDDDCEEQSNQRDSGSPSKDLETLVSNTLRKCCYFLSYPSIRCQMIALETIGLCYIRLLRYSCQSIESNRKKYKIILKHDQKYIYPMIHQSWNALISRMKDMKVLLSQLVNESIVQSSSKNNIASDKSKSIMIEIKSTKLKNSLIHDASENSGAIESLMNESIMIPSTSFMFNQSSESKLTFKLTDHSNDTDHGSLKLFPSLLDIMMIISVLGGDFISSKFKENLWPVIRCIMQLLFIHTFMQSTESFKESIKSNSLPTKVMNKDSLIITPSTGTIDVKSPSMTPQMNHRSLVSLLNDSIVRYLALSLNTRLTKTWMKSYVPMITWYILTTRLFTLIDLNKDQSEFKATMQCLVCCYQLNVSFVYQLIMSFLSIAYEYDRQSRVVSIEKTTKKNILSYRELFSNQLNDNRRRISKQQLIELKSYKGLIQFLSYPDLNEFIHESRVSLDNVIIYCINHNRWLLRLWLFLVIVSSSPSIDYEGRSEDHERIDVNDMISNEKALIEDIIISVFHQQEDLGIDVSWINAIKQSTRM